MDKKKWLAAALALAAFIIIAYTVTSRPETAFDTAVRGFFYSLRADWLDPLVIGLTYLGNTKTIVVICLILLLIPATRIRYGIPVSAAAIIASSLNHFLKSVFMRPRPDVINHIIEQGGWSFPSGHSITSLVVFGLLIWLVRYYMRGSIRRKANILTVLLLIPCFGIGLSRIYVGVHYPTDVLGGWCLGTVVLIAVTAVVTLVQKRTATLSEDENGQH